MTTTNDLLDRMVEALRHCVQQLRDQQAMPDDSGFAEYETRLAEYDRLRASPSQEKAGEDERLGAFQIEMEKELCALVGRPWATSGFSIETLLADLRKKLSAHPTPDADAVAPVAYRPVTMDDVIGSFGHTNDSEWVLKCAREGGFAVPTSRLAPTVATREAVSDAFGYISAENASWLLAGSYRECVVYSYRRDDSDIQLCYAAPGTTRVSETPYCWAPKEGTGHMPTIDCETVRSFETRHFCVPLYLRPASSAIPAAMVTDEIIGAVLNAGHIWDMSMDSARATRGDRLDFIKSSVKRAIAAPPTDRAGDEG